MVFNTFNIISLHAAAIYTLCYNDFHIYNILQL
jgi:hypothetical protein